MRRRDILKAAIAAPFAILAGLRGSAAGADDTTKDVCVLCYKCGQVKGSEKCCKPGTRKCPWCELHKYSPGCCRIDGETEDVHLCTRCGQVKGSKKCCKPGAGLCKVCGLHRGSPGCCRI